MPSRTRRGTVLVLLLSVTAIPYPEAFALITGGGENKAVAEPGWPKGAAAIFNVEARIAW